MTNILHLKMAHTNALWDGFHTHRATNSSLIYTLTSRNVIDTTLSILNRKNPIISNRAEMNTCCFMGCDLCHHTVFPAYVQIYCGHKYSDIWIPVLTADGLWTVGRFYFCPQIGHAATSFISGGTHQFGGQSVCQEFVEREDLKNCSGYVQLSKYTPFHH